MRLVDRYALAEALPPLLVAILGFLVVLLANSLYLLISSSLAELSQLQPQLLVRYAGLSLPGALVLSLPVGMLLAGTLAVVRLAGDREAFALETAGVTFGRLVIPILLLGLLVALGDLALAGWVAPRADALARQTGRVLVYSPRELFPLPDHFFYMGRGYHFYVERADRAAGRLEGVLIFKLETAGPPTLFMADAAKLSPEGAWEFEGLEAWRMSYSGRAVSVKSEEFLADLRRAAPPAAVFRQRPRDMTLPELAAKRAEASKAGHSTRELDSEWHFRLALPMAGLALLALGLPISARFSRAGGYVGLIVTFALAFGYYLCALWLRGLAADGHMPAALASWGPVLLMGLAALWLLGRPLRR